MRLYEENKDEIVAVLAADLRRPKQEALILEFDVLVNDLKNTLINLKSWTAVEKVQVKFSDNSCLTRRPFHFSRKKAS